MAKMTDTEFINKYSDVYSDNSEKQMEFLEDVSDSVKTFDNSEDKKQIEDLQRQLEQAKTETELIKEKYINRFMGGDTILPKAIETPEPQEKQVIDIKEI